MTSHEDDFARKIILSFSTMTRLVWGINQVLIHELNLNEESAALTAALRDAQEDMIAAVEDLGVDVKPFENYKIKTATKKSTKN